MLNAGVLAFDAAGRIETTTALPEAFNGGTPTKGGALAYTVAVPSVRLAGIGYDSAGAVLLALNGAPTQWQGGIPTDDLGRICANDAAPIAYWNAGLPFTLGGLLAVTPAIAPINLSAFDFGYSTLEFS
jgi:hypothetical protein